MLAGKKLRSGWLVKRVAKNRIAEVRVARVIKTDPSLTQSSGGLLHSSLAALSATRLFSYPLYQLPGLQLSASRLLFQLNSTDRWDIFAILRSEYSGACAVTRPGARFIVSRSGCWLFI